MPTVSIIVLNWNGKHFLKNCLDSLLKLTYSKVEIILVDNGSHDGSQQFVRKHYGKKVLLIENNENYGFAEGNNIGFLASKGEYVLFLNNDTAVTPNFLNALVADCEQNPQIGCIQPQMRVMKEKTLIDAVGSFMTSAGFLYHFGYRKKRSIEKYNIKREIFSAKGACIMLPRKVLQKVGIFDEDFFIFFEETDLCYRIWLAGYSVIYEPKSVIYHVVGGDTVASDKYKYARRIYLIFKNTNCSYIKNFGTFNFLTVFPVFLIVQCGVIISFILKLRFDLVKAAVEAYMWNVTHMRETLRKRRLIQYRIRQVTDWDLRPHILKNPGIKYYYYSLFKTTMEYED